MMHYHIEVLDDICDAFDLEKGKFFLLAPFRVPLHPGGGTGDRDGGLGDQ